MKFSKFACLMAAMIALSAQAQTQGVSPASSYSNARSVDIMIRPAIPPSLSASDVNTLIRNSSSAYGKSWTSYFLGQSLSSLVINYDGSITDTFNYAGSQAMPAGTYNAQGQPYYATPQGATPIHVPLTSPFFCGNSGSNVASQGYSITPLFTQEALLNGGAPYGWTVVNDAATPVPGCQVG